MNKHIVSALLAAGVVTGAQAFTPDAGYTFYLSGATAFRNEVWDILNANITAPGDGTDKEIDNKTGNHGNRTANVVSFEGTWANDGSVFANHKVAFFCSWTGSVAGQASMINGTGPVTYAGVAQNYMAIGTCPFNATATPTLIFSDVKQESTTFASSKTKLVNYNYPNVNVGPGTYGVAVVPFVWVGNAAAINAGVGNITDQEITFFLPNGNLSLSYFTGNPASDSLNGGKGIFLCGRDADSGTRASMFMDAKLSQFGGIQQYAWAGGKWNKNALGAGYSSGGSIVTDLNASTIPALSYLGLSDASGLTAPAGQIKYNGAAYGFNGVTSGQYPFWSYENLYILSSAGQTVIDAQNTLAASLDNYYDPASGLSDGFAVRISDMNVYRNADGGQILY